MISGKRTILSLAAGVSALALCQGVSADSHHLNNFNITYHIEVAGADSSNVATDKQLKESGTKMVPAQPSATFRNPLIEEPEKEIQKVEPKPVPDEKPAAPAAESTPEEATPKAADADSGATDAKPAAASADAETKPADPAPSAVKTAEPASDSMFEPYVRIDGGFSITSDPEGSGTGGTHRESKIQNTGFASAGFGARVDDQVRLEGLLTYRAPMSIDGTNGSGSTVAGEVGSVSAMVNFYYDFKEVHKWLGGDTFTPYLGAGAGISMLDTDSLATTGGNTERGTEVYNLTYALMAGVSSAISENLTLDVGYRFINLGQFEHDGTFSNGSTGTATKYDDLLAHEMHAGIRFQF